MNAEKTLKPKTGLVQFSSKCELLRARCTAEQFVKYHLPHSSTRSSTRRRADRITSKLGFEFMTIIFSSDVLHNIITCSRIVTGVGFYSCATVSLGTATCPMMLNVCRGNSVRSCGSPCDRIFVRTEVVVRSPIVNGRLTRERLQAKMIR